MSRARISTIISNFFLVVAVFIAVSCTAKNSETVSAPPAPVEVATPAEPAAPPVLEMIGTVLFTAGQSSVEIDGVSRPLDIGMEVPSLAVIKTGTDGECEIGFGEHGSVRVQPSTTMFVSMLIGDDDRKASELSVLGGTVICKVKKLSGDDQFRVRTPTMVAGVRGTMFMVSVAANKPDRIAVEEGSVAVYPPSLYPEGRERAQAPAVSDDVIREVTGIVSESAPVIAAGEEVLVTEKSIAESETLVSAMLTSLADIAPAATPGTPSAPAQAATPGASAVAPGASAATTRSGGAVSPEVAQAVRSRIGTQMEKYKVVSAGLEVKSVPVTETSRKEIRKAANMAIPEKPTMREVPRATDLTVSLALPPATSSESAVASPSPAATAPSAPATKPAVAPAAKPAAAAPAAKPAAAPAAAAPVEKKPAVNAYAVSDTKLVALAAFGETAVLLTDAKSMVSVLAADGKIAWTFKTANGSNANSIPVTDGRVAAFAGDKSLFVCDAATGAGLWSMDLDTTNSGIYGRRPAIFGDKLFLGTDSGLTVYALKTGKQLGRVAIPDGCDMSPTIFGGKLYITSRTGVFYTIDPISHAVEKQVSSNAGQTVASAAAVGHRFAVFADRKGFMVSVDIEKNTVVWQKKIDDTRAVDVFVDPVLGPAGVYLTAKGSLYGFDPATGAALFVPVANITTSPLATGRSLWCGAKGNMLVEISSSTGAVLRKIPMPAEVSGTPVRIGTDIAVPLMDGRLLFLGRI